MSVKLGLAETARLTPARQVIPEAYEAYLKGMHFFAADRIAKAAAYFEESVRKDPGFAGAHAMLFEADSMMAFERDLPLGDRALRAMRAALELNPNLAEAHSDIGDVKFYWEWDWKAGETEFRKAVELDPRSVDAALHYAYCLHVLGRWDEALRECRRALALDPASRRTNQELFAILVSAHRDEQAIVQFAKTLELSPDNPGAYRRLGALHQRAGRDADALAAYLESQKQRQPGNAAAFEDAARSGGIRGLWKAWLALTLSTPEPVSPLNLAIAYLDAGEKDQSLAMLERSFSQRAPRMAWLKTDPAWDGLRSDPRFQSLLRRMNLAE